MSAKECESPQLLQAVASYWEHLRKGDRDEALQWVDRESWKAFLSQVQPPLRDWRLEDVEPLAEGGCRVSVVTPRDLPAGTFERTVRQHWVRNDEGWKVHIDDRAARLRDSYRSTGPPEPQQGRLEVLPRLLKIHFLSAASQGVLIILNGLEEEQILQRVEMDARRFEIVESPQAIGAGESARLVVRYVGEEVSKELRSRLHLHFASGQVIAVEILYNHLSPGTRALMGLSPEEAEKLRRGEKVTPAIKVPSQPSKPPSGPGSK
ncbi:MAG TPA: hypothetical protein VLV83_01565 [Acidobacteriota bacterium]|nr:hypothetical protein [Acidobacteriota bacterium]